MNKKQTIAISCFLLITLFLSLTSLFASFKLFNYVKSNKNSFLIGQTNPLVNEGNNDDIYLNSTTLNIYKKIDGNWIFMISLNNSSPDQEQNDESKKDDVTNVLHKIKVNNGKTINGSIISHLNEAYYLDKLIFLAKPINDGYELDKLYFNDLEISYEIAFIEEYALFSTLMIDEDIEVRAEFSIKVK